MLKSILKFFFFFFLILGVQKLDVGGVFQHWV